MTPRITVCIPVYNGEAFVAETVASLLDQSEARFVALLSVDTSDDRSLQVCAELATDPRVRLLEPRERLGWVHHCRDLFARVETPWTLLLPHDDLLDRGCLEVLLAAAEQRPAAAAVYGDCRAFGERDRDRFHEPPLAGEPISRMLGYLAEHFNSLAFRGLLRTSAVQASGGLATNPFDDFSAESVWSLKLAWQGEFHRVPEVLWSKRYLRGSIHDRWAGWPAERRLEAWAYHCAEMARFLEALESVPPRSLDLLLHAVLFRLFRGSPMLGPYAEISDLEASGRKALFEQFLLSLGRLAAGDELVGRVSEMAAVAGP